ncbi:MAG: hypothetical protein A2277_07145 [Desulfobacterales bacterium RIFOXYA12_FULL_46_15]|nr:MAG: hypothetical protein A2097_14215 [Desulfobacula sp. GWF2_41_7]OGR28336.1 MAG: hypothetical protein A2277_07145 [Desulfobacterales bacterium RIFOXYA12_FULL_46_15]
MNNSNFVLELDGATYHLSSHILEKKSDFQSVSGCKFLVSDFEKSISRVMHITGDIRYAEAIVARALQDEGEFDEPVTVITHWKKKQGGKNVDIFFTALTSRVYLQYLDTIVEHPDFLTLIPVFCVLAGFINQLNPNDPIAVIFRHNRFADLVIGKKNQFYLATQCTAFDTSEEQIAVLWEIVSREISSNIRETNVAIKKAIVLNWIDTKEDLPTLKDLEIEPYIIETEPIAHENTLCLISFTRALQMFPVMEAITPGRGKLFFYADKLSPFIMAFFAISILLMLYGSFFFQSKTGPLKGNIAVLEEKLHHISRMALSQPRESDYLDTLKFIDSLFQNRNLPSCKGIINDISMGISSSTIVEELKIDFPDRGLKISLTGRVEADFDTAYKEYQTLVSGLQKEGYTVDGNTFNTRIDSSRFELTLSRSIK